MRFDHQAKAAFVVACLALIVAGVAFELAVGYMNIYLRKERVDLREHFNTLPRNLGHWQARGQDHVIDAATVETLGTDIYLDRIYASNENSSRWIALHLAYYTGMIDAIPHVPDRCMVAGGYQPLGQPSYIDLELDTSDWHVETERVHQRTGKPYRFVSFPHRITGRPVKVRMPIGEFRLRTTEFRHTDHRDARIYAGFFFIANGQVTASPYDVRWLAFDKTDRYAFYCKVQFTMIGSSDFTPEDFAGEVSDLLQVLLPELMRCLPDWAEVESWQREDEAPTAPMHAMRQEPELQEDAAWLQE